MAKLCDLPSGSKLTIPVFQTTGKRACRIDSGTIVQRMCTFTLRNNREREGGFMVLYNSMGEPQILAQPSMDV